MRQSGQNPEQIRFCDILLPLKNAETKEDWKYLIVKLAKSARVMLTSNLWVEAGLANGAMGTVEAISYIRNTMPHALLCSGCDGTV